MVLLLPGLSLLASLLSDSDPSALSSPWSPLRAARAARGDRPLRDEMRDAIPFLRRDVPAPSAQNITDVAVRMAEYWDDYEFLCSYMAIAEITGRGWPLPEETADEQATVETYLERVEESGEGSWLSRDYTPLADLLGLAPGMRFAPTIQRGGRVPDDPRLVAEFAEALVTRAAEALEAGPGDERFVGAPAWIRAAIIEQHLRRLSGLPVDRERRVRFVSPEVAKAYVLRHHSALPKVNYRGALYDLGLEIGGRLVAVASVTTPVGALPLEESAHIVEISRIASDGSVFGAASALAGKVLDLVDASRRYGTTRPGLLVTYSLLSELGTTYKSLEARGLRPVAFTPAKVSQADTSSRRSVGALADVAKIRWEAGEEARPADKTLLRMVRPFNKARSGRPLERDDLKPLNVERLRDLLQALTTVRPRIKDRDVLMTMLMDYRAPAVESEASGVE